VAPWWLGGLSGKQSTLSDWLGGTGVVSAVSEQERDGAQVRDSIVGYSSSVTGTQVICCLRIKGNLFKVVHESL
jgi:hypothetical protein